MISNLQALFSARYETSDSFAYRIVLWLAIVAYCFEGIGRPQLGPGIDFIPPGMVSHIELRI